MDFISSIKDYAIQDYKNSKILPSVTIAQAILESGWGKSYLATNGKNLFGIKKGYWQGPTITLPTQEYVNGSWITINAEFRKYNNFGESIKDHGELLNKSWYNDVVNATNYKDQAKALQQCGYATDINYSKLLIQIIEENELFIYDNVQIKESIKSYDEEGQATIICDVLNIRNSPSLTSEVIDTYKKGEVFNYDKVFINDGYYWASYISFSGVRRYVASRTIEGNEKYLSCK